MWDAPRVLLVMLHGSRTVTEAVSPAGFFEQARSGSTARSTMTARPFPIPQDFGLERPRAATYLARAATAHVRAFLTGATPANIAKSLWGDDVTNLILRAATTPATTTTSGWAQQLAATAIVDLIQSITSISAAA